VAALVWLRRELDVEEWRSTSSSAPPRRRQDVDPLPCLVPERRGRPPRERSPPPL